MCFNFTFTIESPCFLFSPKKLPKRDKRIGMCHPHQYHFERLKTPLHTAVVAVCSYTSTHDPGLDKDLRFSSFIFFFSFFFLDEIPPRIPKWHFSCTYLFSVVHLLDGLHTFYQTPNVELNYLCILCDDSTGILFKVGYLTELQAEKINEETFFV